MMDKLENEARKLKVRGVKLTRGKVAELILWTMNETLLKGLYQELIDRGIVDKDDLKASRVEKNM
jgi:hypothetical protein